MLINCKSICPVVIFAHVCHGGLLSPPPSARSSIDITQSSTFLSRREQLPRSNSLQKSVQKLNDTSAADSPPETVVGSAPKDWQTTKFSEHFAALRVCDPPPTPVKRPRIIESESGSAFRGTRAAMHACS
jgi:hypothetical protein